MFSGKTKGCSGFTLVEISIVLIVIGLVIGGIMVGRTLIKSSETRAQISQFESFKLAANSFKIKYNYLPGDIPPTQASQLGFFTFTGTNAGKKLVIANTYYGFGDGGGDVNYNEELVFWQHLSQAGMIAGKYGGDGITNYLQTNSASTITGGRIVNPLGSLENAKAFVPFAKFNSFDPEYYIWVNRFASTLIFFRTSPAKHIFLFHLPITQEYAIDAKLDDGIPEQGSIRDWSTKQWGLGDQPCTTGTTPNYYGVTDPEAENADNCSIAILW